MSLDLSHIWLEIQAELQSTVGLSTYEIWLAPIQPVDLLGEVLHVRVPAELSAWVADRFSGVLDSAATTVLARPVRVQLDADAEPIAAARDARRTPSRRPAEPSQEPAGDEREVPLNPKFCFDQFVIGDTNRFAHASALAVAELPGQAYNPLFIYGPPGVGKTHLLHAIGNYVERYGGGLTVRYTTVERFTNEFVFSLKKGGSAMDRFKGRYRHADVLLIDDIQFLQSKVRTEEEFFHTFNALHEAGSQLVMTSDRLPGDLDDLEDRMRARFASGLVADIGAPDLATRLTVLRKRVHHDGIRIDDPGVLPLVADTVTESIRALEGALIRVVAFASLTGRALDCDLADEVLRGLYRREATGSDTPGASRRGRPPSPAVTVGAIQDLVCQTFSLTRTELLSPGRSARLAWPRQVAMYLAREHTAETLPAIGKQFGGRGHTTVMHAVKATTKRIATDREAYDAVHTLSAQLRAAHPDRQD
ncbi:Chromosomal replication initiator protein DnaA [Paraconexibacter sp. AEG42_29]|uniref:Chromosomal replication initiator protein DnaA n=1 Tax=Paraconexibacter sp. AEG42_29 TaxID=2997339 RepID=A0AAU7ANL8_9ACTN